MSFANPLGLLGLLSLPVIIALHLLRERQTRYVVSSLSLWSFLEPEVRGSRFRKVSISLLLILDLLAAVLLSLALARPQLNLNLPVRNARHLVILVDVSTSMLARDVLPDRFSQAIIDVAAQLNGLGPRDVATLLTFGNQPHWIADTRQQGVQEMLARLAELQAGETGAALLEALAMGNAALDPALPAEFHVFSDGAFASLSLDELPHPIQWHPYGKQTSNQAIIRLSAETSPNGMSQCFIQLANFGDQPVTRVLSLLADGAPLDSQAIDLPANSVVTYLSPPIQGQPASLGAVLVGGDDLKADDSAELGMRPTSQVKVQLVSEQPNPLQQAFKAIPGVELQVFSPKEFTYAAVMDMTVFRQSWPSSLPNGLVLLVEPPQSAAPLEEIPLQVTGKQDLAPGAQLTQPYPSALLDSVDFSGVRWSSAWKLAAIPPDWNILLQVDETPLLIHGQVNGYSVLVLLVDLSQGNFTRHPSFPILLGNMVRSLQYASFPGSIASGESLYLPLSADDLALTVLPPKGNLLEYRTSLPSRWTQTLTPGIYRFEFRNRAGKVTSHLVGVNAGDPFESNLAPQQWMQAQTAQQSSRALDVSQVVELRPWILALLFIILFWEAALAWR